ncbi:MAG TPA: SDR family NAD(P)-dependent oxidoreductase [Galbitalea sp.]|nr:SDR family NAD(P)-dependent oxidoreductase [Galbitalea sp.]
MSVVVVTGATGDAGRAICATLTAAGVAVVAVGSDAERLESVAASFRFVCDLTDATATLSLATRVREQVGGPDGLVHLVGGWRAGHETVDWDWLEPRLLTTLRLTTLAFHDDLSTSPAGRLVTIGSTAAAKPTWGGANYATLKTAADAWVAAIASGWRKAGTAAAVTLLVSSIGGDGTPAESLAARVATLWDEGADILNGARVDLTARE